MGRPARSPLLGYNHNVRFGGRILHVQTEDSGPANPHLFTHLFYEGSILATKRSQYDANESEDTVRTLMQRQHKEILKDLKQGLFNDRLLEYFTSRGEEFVSPVHAPEEPAPAPEPDAPVLQVEAYEEPSIPTPLPAPPPPPLPEPTPSPGPEVLDLDAIPTPVPIQLAPPEAIPARIIRANPSGGPGAYTLRRPTRDIETGSPVEPDPRGLPRPPVPLPTAPVVVQRRIVVGAGSKASSPGLSVAPRPRRPGAGIPYVVQEGSHPSVLGRSAQQGLPPARPMVPSADPHRAPRTAAPPPIPEEAIPESMVSSRSLDDVILAYLSKGDNKR